MHNRNFLEIVERFLQSYICQKSLEHEVNSKILHIMSSQGLTEICTSMHTYNVSQP